MPSYYRRIVRRQRIQLPKLDEREWSVLLSVSDDWENIETIEEQIRRTIGFAEGEPTYRDWQRAWPTGVKREEVLRIIERLVIKGLLNAVVEEDSGRWLPALDLKAFRMDPDAFWFIAEENMQNALREIAAGRIPLRRLREMGGQSIWVSEVLVSVHKF